MRSGELRGLQHQDLDPRTGRVSIQRTRTQRVTGPAKTARSVRQAAITHPTCEATAAWQPGATPESLTVLSRLAQLVPLDATAPLFGSLKCRSVSGGRGRTLARVSVRCQSVCSSRSSIGRPGCFGCGWVAVGCVTAFAPCSCQRAYEASMTRGLCPDCWAT